MGREPSERFTEVMVLLVTILGTGMVYLDQTALNVALPAIQVSLRIDVGGLQWLVDIYILTLAVLLLIGGALGDRYGRVRVFIIGMVIFVAASVAGGLAPSLGVLIAARALQGVGGALLVPGGLAIINATVAPERRGRALGTWGTFSPLVTMSGPLLGGWLVDHASWRAVFFLNVPLGLMACYIAARYVPENRDEGSPRQLDWPGVLTLMLGLGGVLFGMIEGPNYGWTNGLVIASLAVGALGLAAFVWVEWRSPAPLLPLHLFRNRTFTGINLVTLVHYMALSSIFFFLTLNLQQVQGFTAFQAGLAQLPTTVLLIVMARTAGRLTDRIGAVPLIAAGVALNFIGFLLFALPGVNANYWTSFFPAQVVFGIGLGMLVVPLTAVALGALGSQHSGIASGFNNAATRISQMLAVAVFGAVLVGGFRAGLTQRTVALDLPPSARTELLSEARNLGATQPPAGLSAEAAAATQQAIHLAFVDGFRQMMILSAALSLVSLVALLALVRHRPMAAVAPERAPMTGD
jgi:EmrB/QacA subfamily drug resistance transporter